MKKSILIIGIIALLILPLVNADVPSPPNPTAKEIPVVSTITNINDFSDYVFVSYSDFGPCGAQVVGTDGVIPRAGGYGNYCTTVDVYAIKKTDFNISLVQGEDAIIFLNSSKATKVIDSAQVLSKTVSITSTEDKIVNSYNISLNSLVPPEPKVERSYLIYLYLIIPIVAILIVVIVLIKRRE